MVIQTVKKYLNIEEVCALTSISKTAIYKLQKETDFPKPFHLEKMEKRSFWNAEEVNAWMDANLVRAA